MKNHLTETIYEGEHYNIPYDEMGPWFAFMRDLSVFQRDAGNLQIQFIDKFSKYKIEKPKGVSLMCKDCGDWYGININHKCFKCLGDNFVNRASAGNGA